MEKPMSLIVQVFVVVMFVVANGEILFILFPVNILLSLLCSKKKIMLRAIEFSKKKKKKKKNRKCGRIYGML